MEQYTIQVHMIITLSVFCSIGRAVLNFQSVSPSNWSVLTKQDPNMKDNILKITACSTSAFTLMY